MIHSFLRPSQTITRHIIVQKFTQAHFLSQAHERASYYRHGINSKNIISSKRVSRKASHIVFVTLH